MRALPAVPDLWVASILAAALGPGPSQSPCPTHWTFPPFLFQEKHQGPSRRSPGTPRLPGSSRGGRTPTQQGGRAGMGRASRSWEDSPGEQPRGGAGGRGRRGRGRGSPHLSGAGDTSTADRKSKVGARKGGDLCLGLSVVIPVFFYFQMDLLTICLSFCVSFSFPVPPSGTLSLSFLASTCVYFPCLSLCLPLR